jgi:K+-sensing histidine kinase KdpD
MKAWIHSSVGTLSCAAAAACLIPFFRASSSKALLPLLFLAVVVLVAIRFGNVAGILGTIAAAIIFAVFLFEPTRSLGVKDSAERSNLIWMVVGGVAASELLGGPPKGRQKRTH